MAKRTKFQERAIRNFYDNREAISVQRLQELVTDLYLTEGKKQERAWESIANHLQTLKVPQQRIDHLMQKRDPKLVAELVQQLFAKSAS